jgi:hypothetical protein
MAMACSTLDTSVDPSRDDVHVWSCPGDCTRRGSWTGIGSLLTGVIVTADVALGPDGAIGVAINAGSQPQEDLDYALVYASCRSRCDDPQSWALRSFPGVKLYTAAPVIAVDEAGRSVIGFTGDDGDGHGLHVATCEPSCEDGPGWQLRLLDDPARTLQRYPLTPPAECASTIWINRDIRDISARNGRFALSYYLGAVGIGPSCNSEIIDPYGTVNTFYSMTTIAISPF